MEVITKRITTDGDKPAVIVAGEFTAVVWSIWLPNMKLPKVFVEVFCHESFKDDAVAEMITAELTCQTQGWVGPRYENRAEIEIYLDPFSTPGITEVICFSPKGFELIAAKREVPYVLSRFKELVVFVN